MNGKNWFVSKQTIGVFQTEYFHFNLDLVCSCCLHSGIRKNQQHNDKGERVREGLEKKEKAKGK